MLRRREQRDLSESVSEREQHALAQELEEVYPQFATRLADVLARIQACDLEIEHRGLRLLSAEYIARGLEGPVVNGTEVPSLVRAVRLPAWEPSVHEPFAWPRS